ncbi:MAG: hypothetical protein R3F56_00490 [Planctomycetota bacterium]
MRNTHTIALSCFLGLTVLVTVIMILILNNDRAQDTPEHRLSGRDDLDAGSPVCEAPETSARATTSDQSRYAAEERRVLSALANTSPEVTLRDALGNPVVGAAICPAERAQTRWVTKDSPAVRTDVDGGARLPSEWVAHSCVALARGQRPTSFVPTGESRQTVTLPAPEVLSLQFVSVSGLPLSGVDVAVSMTTFPIPGWVDSLPEIRASYPGADPRAAIHSAMSDTQGRVTVGGLLAGKPPCWDAHLPGWAIVDYPDGSEPGKDRSVAGGPVGIVKMAPLAAFGFRVRGGRLASHGGTVEGAHLHCGKTPYSIAPQMRLLQSRFPDCQGLLLLPPSSASEQLWFTGRIVLERGGVRTIRLPFAPVVEFAEQGPHIIDVSNQPDADDSTQELTVQLVQPDGLTLDGCEIWLVPASRIVTEAIVVRSGTSRSVPTGSYTLSFMDSTVRASAADGQRVDVSATSPATHKVLLTRKLYRVQIEKSCTPEETIPPGGMVTLTGANGGKANHSFGLDSAVNVCVPGETISVEVLGASGYEGKTTFFAPSLSGGRVRVAMKKGATR